MSATKKHITILIREGYKRKAGMSELEKTIEETREMLNEVSAACLEDERYYAIALLISKCLDDLLNEYNKKHLKHN